MQSGLYRDLKEHDSIRLLILQPGSRSSPIFCWLEETRISSRPRYVALSYTWGEPVLTNTIHVNGQLIKVRHNLYTALQYIRDTTEPQSLGIDALTINQEDIPERNQQVKIMGQIYKNSDKTLVWLREEMDSDKPALSLLHLCDILANDPTTAEEEKLLRISNSIFRSEESKPEDMASSLAKFLSSNWFRRTWIIQEFALSARIILHCGDTTFLTNGLDLLHRAWQSSSDAALAVRLSQPMNTLSSLMTMRTLFRQSSQADLGFLLYATVGRFEVSEPRDSVFALLSLVNAPGPVLNPDYGLTTAQVFSAAVRISAETGTLYLMLTISCRRPFSSLQQSLPSWVPDFHHRWDFYSTFQSDRHIYSAGGTKSPAFSFSGDGLILTLRGKILDVVNTVLMDVPEQWAPYNIFQDWWRKCRELTNENDNYPTGEKVSECWWRLVICDTHVSVQRKRSRASSGFGDCYLDETIREGCHEEPFSLKQVEYRLSSVRSGGMAFCRTEKRYLGWTSLSTQPDDNICLFQGAAAPWVIRRKHDGKFRLVGEAYIYGIMYGEAVDSEGSRWEDIRLS